MRELKTTDLSFLTRIVKKMGIKEELKVLVKNMQGKKQEEINPFDFYMDVVFMFIENYDKAENEVISFVSDLEEKSKDEIKALSLAEMMNLIQEMLSLDGIGDFFNLVLR
jgi:hypothetical protein